MSTYDLGGGRTTPPCFKCGKEMQRVFDGGSELQPSEGLHFESTGAYGSTVFDPMDGSSLNIIVCDDCIREHHQHILLDQKYVGIGFDPTTPEDKIKGAIFACGYYAPDRNPVPWDPDKDYPRQEPLLVEPEEVAEAAPLSITTMWKATAIVYAKQWLAEEAKRETAADPDQGCCVHGHTRGEHPACFNPDGSAR